MPIHPLTFAALAATVLLAMAAPGGAAPDPIGSRRVLLVAAPNPDDPDLVRQRALFRAMRPGASERHLELVEAVGDGARARSLRERFGLSDREFRAVLVGKDGGAKLSSAVPLGPDRLFSAIDAMPMRRDEMRRRK